MNQFENKCQWLECPPAAPTNAPIVSPTIESNPTPTPTDSPTIASNPTPTPTDSPVAAPALCKNSCYNSSRPWEKLCQKEKCAGCPECTVSPTDAPVEPPVNGGDYCCTWNFYNCGVDTFCNESSANCQGDGSYKQCLDLTDDGSDESEPSPVSAPTDVSD